MSIYFGVKAVILGDFVLQCPICSYSDGYQVSIFIEDGTYKISLIKLLPNGSPLQIRYKNDLSYPIAPDESVYRDYIKQLQQIEALGGFHYGITKILYRETLELTWYTGKDVFQDLSIVYSMKKQYKSPKKKLLSQSNLSSILLLERLIPDALIPYNYFREANEYLHNEQYRQAYLHFYMLLEFCFSNGRTRQKDQIEEFEKSIRLRFALLDTLNTFNKQYNEAYNWIQSKVIDEYRAFSLTSILKLPFAYRGKLAHGIKRSAEYVFDDRTLHHITVFIEKVCFLICGNMQVYCMSSKEFTEKRLNERILKLKDELGLQ